MKAYFEDNGITIFHGEALKTLQEMPDESVNCVVTSPPYWGLRDYNVDGQIGVEHSPEEFISRLVNIFTEVRRVLRGDGTCWVNMGDSYFGATSEHKDKGSFGINSVISKKTQSGVPTSGRGNRAAGMKAAGIKPKDLVGIPWMLAFALRADGWYLRQDIIWSKPSCMPESVTDRCTKSHEYIFLLTKSAKYVYNAEAIAEPTLTRDNLNRDRDSTRLNNTPGRTKMGGLKTNDYEFKNKRSVWTIATKPYHEAHFATFPTELVKPCILAGCPAGGVVLDPFGGAMTTMLVARDLNCKGIAIELNAEYIEIGKRRISQNVLEFSI